MKKLKQAIFVAAALIGSFISLSWLKQSMSWVGKVSDLPEYYAASWLALHGQAASVYSLSQLSIIEHSLFPSLGERTVGFYLSPPAIFLLLPLSLLQPQSAAIVWFCFIFAALVVAIFLLARTFSLTLSQLALFWAVAIIFGPTYEALRVAQLSTILTLMFTIAIIFIKNKNDLAAGLALSFFVIKPHLLVPYMVQLAGGRRWRILMHLSTFLALWLIGAFLLVGNDGFAAYSQLIHSVFQNSEESRQFFCNCPTLLGQALRFKQAYLLPYFIGSGIVYAIFLLLSYRIGAQFRKNDDWINRFILSATPLAAVSSPYFQDYDLVLLLPSIVCFAVLKAYARIPATIMLPLVILNTVLLLPFYPTVRYGLVLKDFPFNPIGIALISLTALFTFAAAVSGDRTLQSNGSCNSANR